ncbi:hypothetical protein MKX54_10370 [Alkalihalobacillus sp. FSL R5-0424]
MIHKNFFIDAFITFAIILTVSTLLGLLFNDGTIAEILLDRVFFAVIFAIAWTILHFAIVRTR